MKIAITGATGQLGQLVVEQLKKRNDAGDLVALVRSPEKASDLGIEARPFDYNNPENLAEALKGVDRLLLISGNEIGQRARQHKNVIDAAKEANVQWIVYTSLLDADNSTISLADEHLETEQALKDSGIDHTVLRNGWYTENYTMAIPSALEHGVVLGSAGEGKISSASRADYAEAAAVVISDDKYVGKVFELAGDEAYTLSDLAEVISKETGKNIPYNNLPEEEYAKILLGAGIPEVFANGLASWDVSASKGDLYHEGKHLSELIGRPTTPMQKTVAEAL